MTQELADFEITSLALQYCGLEPTAQLTVADKKQVADAERLMRLYLMRTDLDTRWTNAQQAAALGCSVATVKRWAAGEEFQKIVNFMAPSSRSPMVDTAKEYLQNELLPLALREAHALLSDPETRASTKANLIKEIWKAGMANTQEGNFDTQRRDAMTWLREQGVSVGQINVMIQNNQLAPEEYMEKLQDALPVEVVD